MYKSFDGMCWPVPDEQMSDLQWRLRYKQDLAIEDRMRAASIVSAYSDLIRRNQKQRNYIVEKIKG